MKKRLIVYLFFLIVFASGAFGRGEKRAAADFYYSEALARIARGESNEALKLLDRVLEKNPRHGPALLERGRLYLKLGLLENARQDLYRASFDQEPEIRASAHIGLGDIYRQLPRRNLQAASEYRLALQADPQNRKALYELAQTGFALAETQGYRMAGKALAELLCLDPDYQDAYSLWRGKIRDQSEKELRDVDACLEEMISQKQGKSHLWLDIATDRFRLGEPELALSALERLESDRPDYKPSESKLLEARCLLDLGDTLGFEKCYDQALEKARETGDFSRILIETEPVFSPEESDAWKKIKSAKEMSAFFRKFWLGRDPDPLTPHNERLVVHYLRLRQAENRYHMLNPHSRFQTSPDYFRLVSPASFFLPYDSDLFWNRCRELTLDQRGLFFIRHGPPDRMTKQVTWSDPMEIWYYGSVHFLFEKHFGAGDFIYMPSITRGAGDIVQAMETETFIDPLPGYRQSYYAADFFDQARGLEIEFYQSAPFSLATGQRSVASRLGIYDSTWAALRIDSTGAAKIETGRDTLWLAAHCLAVAPGNYLFALSLDLPGLRTADHGKIKLDPYKGTILEMSSIVLGSPPGKYRAFYSRKGIAFLPRPSLRFVSGENIFVYLELYGLKRGAEGSRSYREWVTVTQVGEGNKTLLRSFKKIFSLRGKKIKSLTLTFDRSPQNLQGPVAETFTIDISFLVPGVYRLLVELRDNVTGDRTQGSLEFEIAPQRK